MFPSGKLWSLHTTFAEKPFNVKLKLKVLVKLTVTEKVRAARSTWESTKTGAKNWPPPSPLPVEFRISSLMKLPFIKSFICGGTTI